MFSQYRNKIIALVTTVCLLVGMMVIPSGATVTVNYNLYSLSGYVEYPFCDDVFPFESGSFSLSQTYTYNLNNGFAAGGGGPVFDVYIPSGSFVIIDAYFPDATTTHDYSSKSFYLVVSSEDAYAGVYRAQGCYDFMTSDINLINGSYLINEPIFDSTASCSAIYDSFGSVIGIRISGTLLADANIISVNSSFGYEPNLTEGEEISLGYSFNSYNDLQISIFDDADSASDALASAPDRDVSSVNGSCACPSILNLMLSQHVNSNNLLNTVITSLESMSEAMATTYAKVWQIEYNTGELVKLFTPSEQETALKEATSDVTSAYTEKFWGADSDSALGSASITESADILSGTKSLFSTGVSTSDLFGLFGRESWGRWFSEETRADLHTVPDVAVIGLDEDDAKTEYEKNLDSIRDFMGR